MFSTTLYKKSLRSNYKIILIFMGVLTLYFSIISSMYDPNNPNVLDLMAELKFSPEILKAFGFVITDTSFAGVLASYFYGLLMLAFPMIAYIIICNGLVAKLVDKGSMANLLSTPNSRKKIAATQAIFSITAVTIIVFFVTLMGIPVCEAQYPGMLDIPAFIKINIGVWLVHLALSSICFFASCFFNEASKSIAIGAGVPIGFLLIKMLSNANGDIKVLKYLTLFSLYDPVAIIKGDNVLLPLFALAVIAVVFYGLGIVVFDKKDLPV